MNTNSKQMFINTTWSTAALHCNCFTCVLHPTYNTFSVFLLSCNCVPVDFSMPITSLAFLSIRILFSKPNSPSASVCLGTKVIPAHSLSHFSPLPLRSRSRSTSLTPQVCLCLLSLSSKLNSQASHPIMDIRAPSGHTRPSPPLPFWPSLVLFRTLGSAFASAHWQQCRIQNDDNSFG